MASGSFYSFGSTGCSLPFQDSLSQGAAFGRLRLEKLSRTPPSPTDSTGDGGIHHKRCSRKSRFLDWTLA